MSLGSCLVANEMPGQAEAFIQARIDGKSWQQIADEFNLPNPGAARKAFEKATGISDFKIKGQELANLVKQGPDALKAVNEAKAAAKKVKALDDVVQPKHGGFDVPEPEHKTVKDYLSKKMGYTEKDFDGMLEMYKAGKHKDFIVDHWSLKNSEWDDLLDVWKAEGKLTPLSKMEQAVLKAKEANKVDAAAKLDNLKDVVQHIDTMGTESLQQLYNDITAFSNDQEFAFQIEKNKAKQKYLDYLDKYEGTAQYDEAVVQQLSENHKAAVKAYNEFMQGDFAAMQKNIDKVLKAIADKPKVIADIPVNQPVKNKFTSDVNIAQKTGLTPEQVQSIIDMNANGQGYLAIKDKLKVEFAQIDDVVWNELLKKHNGFTWRAYSEKPTSESGFAAVKEKVFEARKKGLTIDEIVGKPGAPPKTVVQAILDDKWKLPSAGTKVPIIPPPPPPPPQVFGGTIPSQSGVNFRRHGDGEMLDWIRPDTMALNSGQRSAITNYTNSGYHDINSYLRGGGLTDTQGYGYTGSNVVKTINNLDATMRPLPVDTIVTRNFSGVQHLPAKPEEMVGLVYHDNAFLSTTVKEAGVFSGDVQLIIHAPQGTMSRYVNDISVHKSEQELLLARGTRMVVTKVEKHGDGYSTKWRLFCEVIAG